jgi:hypothetical protein
MHKVLAGAIAATVIAGGAVTADAEGVCIWSEIGVWQCGDGHVVTQVYQLPAQPNTIITPVATVPPNGYPLQNYPTNNPYGPR